MIQPPRKSAKKAKKPDKTAVKKSGDLIPIKGTGGIPAHEPTQISRNLVLLACSLGYTQEQIGELVGIAEGTLRKHYEAELADGGRKITLGIAGNLASIAQDRNHPKAVTAAIFWLKTKGGFRENVPTVDDASDERVTFTINIGGSGGPPRPEPMIIDG